MKFRGRTTLLFGSKLLQSNMSVHEWRLQALYNRQETFNHRLVPQAIARDTGTECIYWQCEFSLYNRLVNNGKIIIDLQMVKSMVVATTNRKMREGLAGMNTEALTWTMRSIRKTGQTKVKDWPISRQILLQVKRSIAPSWLIPSSLPALQSPFSDSEDPCKTTRRFYIHSKVFIRPEHPRDRRNSFLTAWPFA